ncbi:hypothetical protein AOLI_G00286270 [Acnodon oligacanthus]
MQPISKTKHWRLTVAIPCWNAALISVGFRCLPCSKCLSAGSHGPSLISLERDGRDRVYPPDIQTGIQLVVVVRKEENIKM